MNGAFTRAALGKTIILTSSPYKKELEIEKKEDAKKESPNKKLLEGKNSLKRKLAFCTKNITKGNKKTSQKQQDYECDDDNEEASQYLKEALIKCATCQDEILKRVTTEIVDEKLKEEIRFMQKHCCSVSIEGINWIRIACYNGSCMSLTL
ncbi:hypothetical protein J437_LFUL017650 [Ladona fulva]|uniref:Uncharacterized protein n=1 Tax=Ladona fulva TaxID=123851 RepID=A0A8K0KMP7_LADFU|nr:hypothetical protein J437_LFUL017650 [Ladona fulva]